MYASLGRDFDVRRLQVPVDDAFFVRLFEAVRDLLDDGTYFIDRKRSVRQTFCKRLALDELHDEVMRSVVAYFDGDFST